MKQKYSEKHLGHKQNMPNNDMIIKLINISQKMDYQKRFCQRNVKCWVVEIFISQIVNTSK